MIECIQVTTADVVLKIIYQTETIKNFRYLWLHLYLYNIEHRQTETELWCYMRCTALLLDSYTLVFRDDIWTVVQLQLNLVFLVVEQLQLWWGRVPGSWYFAADHSYHPYYYQNQEERNQEKSHSYGDYSEMSLVKVSWIPTLWLLLSYFTSVDAGTPVPAWWPAASPQAWWWRPPKWKVWSEGPPWRSRHWSGSHWLREDLSPSASVWGWRCSGGGRGCERSSLQTDRTESPGASRVSLSRPPWRRRMFGCKYCSPAAGPGNPLEH